MLKEDLIIQDHRPNYVARLLIIRNPTVNIKLVNYMLGQAGLYTEAIVPFAPNMVKATVCYWTDDAIRQFIQGAKTLKVYRILSACCYPSMTGEPHKWTPTNSQFLEEAADQILSCVNRGTAIRIDSSDKPLRKAFYECALKTNSEHGLGCTFDYTKYDFRIILRQIYMPGTKKAHDHYWVLVHFDPPQPAIEAEIVHRAACLEDFKAWEFAGIEELQDFEKRFS